MSRSRWFVSICTYALVFWHATPAWSLPIDATVTKAVRYYELGWRFVPLLSATRVEGVLAWRPLESLVGSNLGVLWFQRQSNGTWQAIAWPANSLGLAVLTIRAIPGREQAFEAEADLLLHMHRVCAGEDPVQVIKGLLEDDPLQPVLVNNPDAPSIIEALALLGWQVAPDLSPLMSGTPRICHGAPIAPIDDFMNMIVAGATMSHYGESFDPDDCPEDRPWPCEGCTGAYTGTTGTGPWTLTVKAVGNYKRCIWTRPATSNLSYTGRTMVLCNACPATTSVTGCEFWDERVPPNEPCPPAPESGTFIDENCAAITQS